MPDLIEIANAAADARRTLTAVREGIAWFQARGVAREQLLAQLDQIEDQDRDFTDLEYAAMAGQAQDAIARLLAASDDSDAGAPPPTALLGSDTHADFADESGDVLSLGAVVALAHEDSGLTAQQWNALPQAERDARIAETAMARNLVSAET